LPERAHDGDIAHFPQIRKGKVQAHTKHQKDDPQFGQLIDGFGIGQIAPG
jgi:hypothetical protein